MKYYFGIFSFLEDISSLSRAIFSSISCSLKEAFLFLLAILWDYAFGWVYLALSHLPFSSLLFQLFVNLLRQPLCLLAFFSPLGWLVTFPVQCYQHLSIVLQALCIGSSASASNQYCSTTSQNKTHAFNHVTNSQLWERLIPLGSCPQYCLYSRWRELISSFANSKVACQSECRVKILNFKAN